MSELEYAVFDHDLHGQADPEIDQGRVYFDAEAGRVVCSLHGDACATDGSASRPVTEFTLLGVSDAGLPEYDPNPKTIGDARLYRCTVCGQGTWSHLAA